MICFTDSSLQAMLFTWKPSLILQDTNASIGLRHSLYKGHAFPGAWISGCLTPNLCSIPKVHGKNSHLHIAPQHAEAFLAILMEKFLKPGENSTDKGALAGSATSFLGVISFYLVIYFLSIFCNLESTTSKRLGFAF